MLQSQTLDGTTSRLENPWLLSPSSSQSLHIRPLFSFLTFHIQLSKYFDQFFFFSGLHLWHMEVPRLGVELQLPAYITATAMPDQSFIYDLHHSSW